MQLLISNTSIHSKAFKNSQKYAYCCISSVTQTFLNVYSGIISQLCAQCAVIGIQKSSSSTPHRWLDDSRVFNLLLFALLWHARLAQNIAVNTNTSKINYKNKPIYLPLGAHNINYIVQQSVAYLFPIIRYRVRRKGCSICWEKVCAEIRLTGTALLVNKGGLKMAFHTFLQEYMQIPIVTRVYTTACVITTLAVVRIYIYIYKCSSSGILYLNVLYILISLHIVIRI